MEGLFVKCVIINEPPAFAIAPCCECVCMWGGGLVCNSVTSDPKRNKIMNEGSLLSRHVSLMLSSRRRRNTHLAAGLQLPSQQCCYEGSCQGNRRAHKRRAVSHNEDGK